jgi:hypothetical protein
VHVHDLGLQFSDRRSIQQHLAKRAEKLVPDMRDAPYRNSTDEFGNVVLGDDRDIVTALFEIADALADKVTAGRPERANTKAAPGGWCKIVLGFAAGKNPGWRCIRYLPEFAQGNHVLLPTP